MTDFGAFWNFTDVRFRTFSVLTDVGFGENEISTYVRFRAFFWGQNDTREGKKNLTPKGGGSLKCKCAFLSEFGQLGEGQRLQAGSGP